MPVSCLYENNEERCYINDTPTNEDCISLTKYLEKYWDANIIKEYDVGFSSEYKIKIKNIEFYLHHESGDGNYFTQKNGYVSDKIDMIIHDLNKRFS
ncbi:hypothetical protein HK11_02005 [Acetobacter sp. DmW_043]|uniref:hypothetical protein n=1 Tax=Acetobacter sp. DmW_043 TaxID=1670658 RepID=UPI000A389653|nr:hypothetical protein [Acetobacter sp. DmW_043]OUI85608.1 hypothetical protein HK11_02005 [Acetobacter sp. DmW_043]